MNAPGVSADRVPGSVRSYRRNLRRASAVLLVGLLAVSACSSDDGGEDAAATTQAATATTSPPVRHHELTPEEIEEYQNDLDSVGCWAGPVDGILGPRTEAALREFQEAEGLEVTGLFGGQSQGALTAAAQAGATVCGDGETTETAAPVDEAAVHELEVWQHDLNIVGCWAGAEDGTLGPQTVAAIRNYPTNAGLPVTGELDAMTEETLAESAAEGGQVCHAATSSTSGSSGTSDDADTTSDQAAAASCQVNSAGTWQTQQQALDYIARLEAAGFGGFGITAGQGGVIVLRPDLTESQATELIARMNAAGFSARYFCD